MENVESKQISDAAHARGQTTIRDARLECGMRVVLYHKAHRVAKGVHCITSYGLCEKTFLASGLIREHLIHRNPASSHVNRSLRACA